MSDEKTKTKAPRAPMMTSKEKFALFKLVEAADASVPDVELARQASASLGRKVNPATVKDYREKLGLKSVKAPRPSDLAARVKTLEAAPAAAGIPIPA